ncbi:unnamed protein product [Ceratitis capitata]|uniref:(Mediterranean fruit fly) hypothetical protein n=1 Tax=Ceratitis capitata TaxID=7213 RepID=A0A811U8K1_CERCA|nr:unnamed protein product [Ceratitis capitata]
MTRPHVHANTHTHKRAYYSCTLEHINQQLVTNWASLPSTFPRNFVKLLLFLLRQMFVGSCANPFSPFLDSLEPSAAACRASCTHLHTYVCVKVFFVFVPIYCAGIYSMPPAPLICWHCATTFQLPFICVGAYIFPLNFVAIGQQKYPTSHENTTYNT